MEIEKMASTRMSKGELKTSLLTLGYNEEQLSDESGVPMKRPELLEKLKDHQQGLKGLTILSNAEEDNDVGVEISPDTKGEQKNIDAPIKGDTTTVTIVDEFASIESEKLESFTPNDAGWTQYVLGKFLEDEMDGRNPRVEGLRRVAGELVGELIEEGCNLVAEPTEANNFRACTKAWGIFLTPEGRTKRFEALADAHADNCHEDYATYLVAMSDTRAKGRVFRNALHLRRVVAAEEISKTMAATADTQQGGAIHTSQITMIRMISERNGFNITEVLDNLGIKYELNEQTSDVNLQLLTYENALMVAKTMREMKEAREKE